MPESDFLSEKVTSIRERFGIIDSVTATVEVFEDFFDTVAEGKPPKIEIHLADANSIYDFGDEAYALDMAWYEPYKPSVDTVLSSMIWVFFVWRVFTNLPNIISGVGGIYETDDKLDDVRRGFKPKKRRK